MDIKRARSQPSGRGPEEYFTGVVRVDPLFDAHDPGRANGAAVTFEPGACTAWLGNLRRLVVRYDRSLTIYQAFIHIAFLMIVLRRVLN